MTDYADLIERLEKASGPDAALNSKIEVAVGRAVWEAADMAGLAGRVSRGGEFWEPAPNYTGSIDAALTLIPDGWEWSVGSGSAIDPGFAEVWPTTIEIPEPHHQVWARTPALALCLAALRARSRTGEG